MSRQTVSLHGVAETLLISLAARAWDAQSTNPILGDESAVEIMKQLDYDFTKVRLPPQHCASVAVRTRILDQWTTSFLERHPKTTVIHLGCGLDNRAERVEWGSGVCWIDVDLPEVVALRTKVMPVSLSDGRQYRLSGAELTSRSWLKDLALPREQSTVVVMEGFLSYLTKDDSQALLSSLADFFREGELLFECINSLLLSIDQHVSLDAVRMTGAKSQSAVDDVQELANLLSNGRVLEVLRFVDAPDVSKMSWTTRLQLYILSWVPGLRDTARFVRLGFGSVERLTSGEPSTKMHS